MCEKHLTETGIGFINRLKLKSLLVSVTKESGQSLKKLKEIPVESIILTIHDEKMGDRELSHLHNLKNLRRLYLYGTGVSFNCMASACGASMASW